MCVMRKIARPPQPFTPDYADVPYRCIGQEPKNSAIETTAVNAPCGAGAPLFPLVHLLPHLFSLFYFSLSFIGFTDFLLLSIPSLSTRIVPLRFQAGGRRRRPNQGL